MHTCILKTSFKVGMDRRAELASVWTSTFPALQSGDGGLQREPRARTTSSAPTYIAGTVCGKLATTSSLTVHAGPSPSPALLAAYV